MTKKDNFFKGILKENPIFVLFLGMCPTLGVTNSLNNAIGMGLSVVFVLILSNILVSLIRKIVPNEIRIPVYITIIATTVTILEILLNVFVPTIYDSLGIFLTFCIINALKAIVTKASIFMI